MTLALSEVETGPTESQKRILSLPASKFRDLLDKVSEDEAQALILDRCAVDGLFWLTYVSTRDEADPTEDQKPFPLHLAYVRQIWSLLEQQQVLVVAKSRQMMMSWLATAFCVWIARFRPNRGVYWQSQKWEDAVAMICMPDGGFKGRCQFIEDNLPRWMQAKYKPAEGRMQYENGSIIQALSGGSGAIRGKTVSLYVGDEFAHMEDQEGIYTAVSPLIQKGSKALFISTPNGSSNTFATLYHGRPLGTDTYA